MKVFIVTRDKINFVILTCIILVGVVLQFGRTQAVYTMAPVEKKVIVLDAGHGGWDPGKAGTNGLNEKDINLKIVEKLQKYLEQSGAVVLVTRNTDEALDSKKKGDMLNRKNIIDESKADIMVSIHQNSFPQARVKGAQVFYFGESNNGRQLAESIQKSLIDNLDKNNTRQAKSNTDYYILKKTEIPSAIVECGFLSNSGEEALLNDDEYQETVAWSVYIGIIDYFSNQTK